MSRLGGTAVSFIPPQKQTTGDSALGCSRYLVGETFQSGKTYWWHSYRLPSSWETDVIDVKETLFIIYFFLQEETEEIDQDYKTKPWSTIVGIITITMLFIREVDDALGSLDGSTNIPKCHILTSWCLNEVLITDSRLEND